MIVADREETRPADRTVDVKQRYGLKVGLDRPAATVPLFRPDVARVPQAGHRPAHDDGIGAEHARDLVRGHRAFMARHVEQHMEHSREARSEEHTSELQSLMRISYAVFCLNKKITNHHIAPDK